MNLRGNQEEDQRKANEIDAEGLSPTTAVALRLLAVQILRPRTNDHQAVPERDPVLLAAYLKRKRKGNLVL